MATKTFYGEFREDVIGKPDTVKTSWFRLHVPAGLFDEQDLLSVNDLRVYTREGNHIEWEKKGFHAYGGGSKRECYFRLRPEPEACRLYTREILIRKRTNGQLEFAEGHKFLSAGKSWFAETLANMFIQQ